ncbi:hypothetical protein [Komagataeibacter sp. FNDCF1]|uniref:hypothetical protein n=1 Tax=Komagataeibacter sp. FNDCF1 TaxID=2878681 RepID=UPI001E5EDFC8|nr:hypothetical protein [Komagataeibacter sp. FNDCF1]MCE2565185.1 hypothetical protein [Komagataeibacter sp. FNDCF1]
MPSPAHAPANEQDTGTAMPVPASRTVHALPLTWMARAWWQRVACVALPCALMWGLIAWAVVQP